MNETSTRKELPFIFSNAPEDRAQFEAMLDKTIASFFASVKDNSAFSGVDPFVLRKQIADLGFLPEKGIGFDETMKKVESTILPNLLRTWSTQYMPHLHAPALVETIASELLIAAFNDSMDSWDQGPAATEIEESMVNGLLNLYGYGEGSDGTFTSGGSQSNICAIIAARDWYVNTHMNWDIKWNGLPADYSKLRLYTSEISHFSMDKACHILGLGYNAVRKIPVDAKAKIDVSAFEKMLQDDVEQGLLPFCAVATIGTTDFGSIDDVAAMRRLCDKYNMHLHADAAYGSAAIMSSAYRSRLGDLSLCDSITVDFHKMFLLPISCSVVLLKEGARLKCFELHADYLNREEDEEDGYINLVGKSMQTTRRFDALKVFMAFQTRGMDGFDRMVTKVIENADYYYSLIKDDPDFIVAVKPELSSVVFALKDGDEVNKKVRRKLLNNGIVIGQTVMNGRVMLKFTLLNPNLEHKEFEQLIRVIKQYRDDVK
ncbi:MAG: pyridoxal-dependent decarboxylase [Sphaerochaetaceae bacterium]|nr:pyridoxal-dependent decarboxylase [Sphaerochaetaceae bacterium]